MMVDCYMKDGRTTFRFTKRAHVVSLVKRRVSDSDQSIKCWVRRRPDEDFMPGRLQLLNDSGIAFVEEVLDGDRAAFEERMGISVAPRPKSLADAAVRGSNLVKVVS